MSDKQLLELAAKAAGAVINGYRGSEPLYAIEKEVEPGQYEYAPWNPLENDGDALRLAVNLGIDVCQAPAFCESHAGYYVSGHVLQKFTKEPRGDDPVAATRRAIVRAAAEVGRSESR